MNDIPPDQGDADEVDDLYRRASAADTSRPSDSVRRAVLDHAAQLAAQRSREAGPVNIDFTRRAANQPWRRPAIFGALAAAALAGLMIAPQFFSPRVTNTSAPSIAENTQRQSAAAPAAKAPADAQPSPFPARPLQANDQMAKVQTDKRRDLKAGASARVAERAEALHQETVADSARAETETLTNVLVTQAQSGANGQSAMNGEIAGRGQSATNVPRAASAPGADNPASSASDQAGAKTEAQRLQSIQPSLRGLLVGGARTAAPVPALPTAAPAAPAAASAATPSAARAADPGAPLRRAAEVGDLPALQTLLDNKPAIDARDDGGRTALMLATLNGQSRAVNLLLASGADPNAADAQGTTPLQAATAAHQPAIAAALRLAGAR
jgi:hypothetical protein